MNRINKTLLGMFICTLVMAPALVRSQPTGENMYILTLHKINAKLGVSSFNVTSGFTTANVTATGVVNTTAITAPTDILMKPGGNNTYIEDHNGAVQAVVNTSGLSCPNNFSTYNLTVTGTVTGISPNVSLSNITAGTLGVDLAMGPTT